MLTAEIELLAQERRVVAIDAPSCGDSDKYNLADVASMAYVIEEALDRLGVNEFALYALNGGCAAAVEIARSRSHVKVVLEAPAKAHRAIPNYAEIHASAIKPRWDSGHPIALWHTTRNRRLFRPWFEQRTAARHPGAARLDPGSINREVLAYLESWRTYSSAWRAVLEYPALERAHAIGRRLTLTGQASDEFFDRRFQCLSEALHPRVSRLRQLLGGNYR